MKNGRSNNYLHVTHVTALFKWQTRYDGGLGDDVGVERRIVINTEIRNHALLSEIKDDGAQKAQVPKDTQS